MKTYCITKKQLDVIEEVKKLPNPFVAIMGERYGIPALYNSISNIPDGALLRYIGGDPTIKFEVKEKLYLLHRLDRKSRDIYFYIPNTGNPEHTFSKSCAFIAPLEDIKRWVTPAWEIKEVNA
ncbi:hypothetical protein [Leuconostoc carnosum]|uniref:hypothetical protein n=1 Tax=Leuconostoc carnosum TaxID=1252 RepID=UPI001239F7A0|nr:hypothetical protein [Leuconostoc carnosum]KAA8327816.1 hypothetical protein FE409_07255 [Leuconostoc carnosum]KAA8375282.1 hypothetical protein FE408_07310 [Leuconostoc carnosum]